MLAINVKVHSEGSQPKDYVFEITSGVSHNESGDWFHNYPEYGFETHIPHLGAMLRDVLSLARSVLAEEVAEDWDTARKFSKVDWRKFQ